MMGAMLWFDLLLMAHFCRREERSAEPKVRSMKRSRTTLTPARDRFQATNAPSLGEAPGWAGHGAASAAVLPRGKGF
jgi:hypothetical protein